MTETPRTADDLLAVAERLTEIAKQLAARVPQRTPVDDEVHIGDEAPLGALEIAQRELSNRIVKRAIYTAGRTLLAHVDAWVATDAEHLHADDIRTMINDMCRELGAPAPWRP